MIKNIEAWKMYVEHNKDPYGKSVIDVARKVMEYLDALDFNNIDKLISRVDNELKAGLTGFQADCVKSIISQVYSKGSKFKKKFTDSEIMSPIEKIIETLKNADNEFTAAPYWVIIDPVQMMKPDPYAVAGMITGIFFSREDATSYLKQHRYNYSKKAVVFCMSGYASDKYYNLCKKIYQEI